MICPAFIYLNTARTVENKRRLPGTYKGNEKGLLYKTNNSINNAVKTGIIVLERCVSCLNIS